MVNKSDSYILPGIKRIGYVNSKHLPRRVDLTAISGLEVPLLTAMVDVNFFDEPTCECKYEQSSGGGMETVSLKFTTGRRLPRSPYIALVVTDVMDRSFLIGSKENPLPVLNATHRIGTPSGDAGGWYYEITHMAIRGLVRCRI